MTTATTLRRDYPERLAPLPQQSSGITWHIHFDDYGLYSFETWWLTRDGQTISPVCPSEATPIADVDYYCEGEKVSRVVRTETKHPGDYALVGRSFDGRAHHVVAVECACEGHEVEMA